MTPGLKSRTEWVGLMNVFLWVLGGVLAAVFLPAGAMKLSRPPQQLVASGLDWAEDFAPSQLRVIGALEVLAALGLVVPPLAGMAEILAPLAATGLVLMMAGAAVVHGRRGEFQMIMVNVIILAVAAVVAWGRFGPYSFTS